MEKLDKLAKLGDIKVRSGAEVHAIAPPEIQVVAVDDLNFRQFSWLRFGGPDEDVNEMFLPLILFAHIPLWSVYPDWGWGTSDSEQALGYLKRFGSVTVLNGHIHQAMKKVEGNVTFYTAMSTAFPQAAPGMAPAPGPLKVPADRLRSVLGVTDVNFIRGRHTLGITDSTLAESM